MTETELQNLLDSIVRRITERVQTEKIILFGSYARGKTAYDSDLDLLVVMHVEGSRRQAANAIDLALADRTVPMDVVVVTPEEYDRQKNLIGTIVREAVREGKVLYERAA